jgi:hypothetical protein
MLNSKHIGITLCFALATSGCSSRPRYFTPTLNPPATDAAAFETNMATCRQLVGRGYKSNFVAQAASIGTGTLAAGGVTGASFAATAGFFESTAASTALGAAALPVGFLVGFGVSRAIRGGREKKLKTALTDCMSEYGYAVEAWVPTKRPKAVKPAAS